jgi:NTE family protein
MGSIVGGLYASGMPVQEIEREMTTMDWNDLFQDAPDRADRSFRRKRDDDFYAFKAKAGFNGGKVEIPLAYIRGQKFDLELNRLMLPVADVKNFDNLSIPYRAVAADLETSKEVILASGSLPKAIRASMAVPAAFDPVEIDGRLLVDGGIANNVPVSVARSMGADVFIVVDVGSGLASRKDLKTGLDVSGQLAGFMFTLNTEQQLKTLTSRDVLIKPALGDIGGGSFDRAAEAIPIGEASARSAMDALRRYSLDPKQYARHLAARGLGRPGPAVMEFVRIENHSRISDTIIANKISIKSGDLLDVSQLEQDIGQIYGLEIFESVRYEVVREDGKTGLVINAREKHWGPGYLQFGLATSNDLQGDSTLRFGALYTRTEINALNGEWRLATQFGDEPGIFTEIYQPLDTSLRYFVSGRIGYGQRNVNLFDGAGNQLARFQLIGYVAELSAGREFGTWGEGRFGYFLESATAEVDIGLPAPDIDADRGEMFLRLSDDKLDNLYFPSTGHLGRVEYRVDREGLGSNVDYDQLLASYVQAFSWGSNVFVGTLSGSTTKDDNAPLEALFQLGGFQRLSGLRDNELSGQHTGFASLVYLRRLTDLQFFRAYAGASVELGNVWQNSNDVSLDNTITAGSAFLAFDTPIGPLYLAYGRTDTDRSSLYLYLGPRFVFH